MPSSPSPPISPSSLECGDESTFEYLLVSIDFPDHRRYYSCRRRVALEHRLAAILAGPRDRDQGGVAVRDRIEGDLGFMSTDAALQKLIEERDSRTIRQVVKSDFSGFGDEGVEGHEY